MPSEPDGLFVGRVGSDDAVPAAHPLAGRGAGNRGSVFVRPAAERGRSASVQRRPLVRTGLHAGRQADDDRRRCGVRFAVWAPNARASPWWAISTAGTVAGIRCASASRPGCGSCSFRGCRAARSTSSRFSVPMGTGCRSRPIRWRAQVEAPPRHRLGGVGTDAVSLARRALDARARAANGALLMRRCRSTRCTPDPGSQVAERRGDRCTGTSSADQLVPYVIGHGLHPCRAAAGRWSTRSAVPGATSHSVSTRRPATFGDPAGFCALRRCAATAPASA